MDDVENYIIEEYSLTELKAVCDKNEDLTPLQEEIENIKIEMNEDDIEDRSAHSRDFSHELADLE